MYLLSEIFSSFKNSPVKAGDAQDENLDNADDNSSLERTQQIQDIRRS
jgi:hypothetical protein